MASPWEVWDDMPGLVDANGASSGAPRNIPPPTGAAMMPPTASRPPPRPAPPPTNMQQYPWGTPYPQPQDLWASSRQYYDPSAYPPKSAPSPYIPRQPLHAPMQQSHSPFTHHHHHHQPHQPHPSQPQRMPNQNPPPPNAGKRSHANPKQSPWPSQGDLSPLDLPTRMPDVQMFTPHAHDMHTPSSSLSQSISSRSNIPPGVYHERPQQWRSDFKFKSSFASMFRSKSSNTARSLDNMVDSSKLELHPFLRYSKSRPMTIYDLRREPLTLVFRELGRPPFADDMDHSVTYPPTKYMRIYHSRLPWYLDISANGAPYISLADFYQQLFSALGKQISKHDFYNNDLDDEDREVLTHAYLDRCRSDGDRKEGVKRVDFLRGRFEWMGLSPGKNGMWRLKTT